MTRVSVKQVGDQWRVLIERDGRSEAYWFNAYWAAIAWADANRGDA